VSQILVSNVQDLSFVSFHLSFAIATVKMAAFEVRGMPFEEKSDSTIGFSRPSHGVDSSASGSTRAAPTTPDK
jgi:hypothetical protein